MSAATADRPAVVLLHSSGSTSRQWQDLALLLHRDFRTVAVDFYGHGSREEWPQGHAMSLEDEARFAQPLLELAGGAHLVGHSYGGAVALKLASLHPHLVRSVVAYEPVTFRLLLEDWDHPQAGHEVVRAAQVMRECTQRGQTGDAARIFADFWSGPRAWNLLSARAQQSLATRMPSILRHFDALFREPFPRDQLARMGVPMLFLSGSRTVPVARRIAQLLRAGLPLAEHEELPGLGHLGPVTHARIVNERIRQFLAAQRRFPEPVTLPGSLVSHH